MYAKVEKTEKTRVVRYKPPTPSEWRSVQRLRARLEPLLPQLTEELRAVERTTKSSQVYSRLAGVLQEKYGLKRFEVFVFVQYQRSDPHLLEVDERYSLQRRYFETTGEQDVGEALRWLNAYRLAAYRASH